MEKANQERRGWMPYILTTGFVSAASGAALPASFDAVIRQILALF